jgi:hypothetical protein
MGSGQRGPLTGARILADAVELPLVLVILSEAKNLQFRSAPSQCRFFASLRMTDFRET